MIWGYIIKLRRKRENRKVDMVRGSMRLIQPACRGPQTFFTMNCFHERQFFHRQCGEWFRMIQVFYIYCVFYFYYYYISSSSDHQALIPRGWNPWRRPSYLPYFHFAVPWMLILFMDGDHHGYLPSRN